MNIEELKTQLKDGVKKAWPDGTVVTGEISIGGRTVVLVVTKDNDGDWASKIKDNSKSLHKVMIGAFDKEGNADKVTAELTVRGMGVPRGVLKKKTAPPDKIVKYLLDYFSKVDIGESKADKFITNCKILKMNVVSWKIIRKSLRKVKSSVKRIKIKMSRFLKKMDHLKNGMVI